MDRDTWRTIKNNEGFFTSKGVPRARKRTAKSPAKKRQRQDTNNADKDELSFKEKKLKESTTFEPTILPPTSPNPSIFPLGLTSIPKLNTLENLSKDS